MSLHKRWVVRFAVVSLSATFAIGLLCRSARGDDRPSSQPSAIVRTGDSEVHFNQGKLAYYDGRYSAAETDFRQCTDADANDAEADYYLGLSLAGENRLNDALVAYDQALTINPSLNEVRAARAGVYIQQKNLAAAKADADALAADPKWADTAELLRGQIAYASGDYKGAEQEFAQARAMGGPEAAAAGLYEGLTQVQLKELNQAQATFRQVAGVTQDPSLAAASRAMSSNIDQTSKGKPFSIQLSTGYELDSNVPLIDTNTPLPPGTKRRQDGQLVVAPQASVNFLNVDDLVIGADTSDYFGWHNLDSNYDIDSYDVGLFTTYRLSQNVFAGGRYDFNYQELGYSAALTRNALTPQLTVIEPSVGYTTGYLQLDDREYHQAPPTPELNESGVAFILGLAQGINFTSFSHDPGESPRLELTLQYEHDATRGSDFDGDFVTTSATMFFPICRHWIADAGLELGGFDYANGNSLDNNHARRMDYEIQPQIGVTWQVMSHLAVRGDYSYIYHESNVVSGTIRPYEYRNNVLGLRVILTY